MSGPLFSRVSRRQHVANAHCSDTSATPERQAEQIKGIYPIVDGQKATTTHTHSRANSTAPEKAETMGHNEHSEAKSDPVDVAQNGGTAAPLATEPPAAKSPDEIENILASTGKPADGPLIDFSQDMKRDLPGGQGQPKDTQG